MNKLLLSATLPLFLGPITFVLMQGIKALSKTVDALPSVAKRFAVATIAVVLTVVAQVTGVDVACDPNGVENCLSTLDAGAVKGILAAAVAYVLHFAKTKKGNAE
jgi:hypothetical protein